MKKGFAPVLLASFLSALFAIFIYRQIDPAHTILVREVVPTSYAHEVNDFPAIEGTGSSSQLRSEVLPGARDFVYAANAAKSAVVSVQSTTSTNNMWRAEGSGMSTGSGVIISPDGYIATNNHVIDNGQQIQVMLDDQREYTAKVIGRDAHTDLALLKVEGKNLPFLNFGNSDSLEVGEWVLAIGNPFRLHSTVTAGIVSAKGRSIHIMRDASGIEAFIQTDAAVNPGNSGGALVNANGRLLGINTAIITYSGQYEGFSFAVPSNLARKVLDDLRDFGKVQRGWMGITIRQVDAQMAKDLKLKKVGGIFLDEVLENSAAHFSGLKPGDVILSINGVETKTTPQFMELVGRMRPGDKLDVSYSRLGRIENTDVVLSDDRVTRTSLLNGEVFTEGDEVLSKLGFELRDLTEGEEDDLGTTGVIVQKIYKGSKIDKVNMEEDYIITKINGTKINNRQELLAELKEASGLIVLDGFYEEYPGKFPYAFHMD